MSNLGRSLIAEWLSNVVEEFVNGRSGMTIEELELTFDKFKEDNRIRRQLVEYRDLFRHPDVIEGDQHFGPNKGN